MSFVKIGTSEAPVEISDSDEEPRAWMPRSRSRSAVNKTVPEHVDLTLDDSSQSRPNRPQIQTLPAKRFYSSVTPQVTRPRAGDPRVEIEQPPSSMNTKNASARSVAKANMVNTLPPEIQGTGEAPKPPPHASKAKALPSRPNSGEKPLLKNQKKPRHGDHSYGPLNAKDSQASKQANTSLVRDSVKHGNSDKSSRVAVTGAQEESIVAAKPNTTAPLSIAGMEKILQGIAFEMANDHARFVKFQLEDMRKGRNRLLETLPDFREDTEPFADLRNIAVSPASNSTISVNHYFIRTGTRKHTNIPLTIIPASEERVPRFKHYIHINRSMLVGDARQLAYEPYLGDTGPDEEEARKKWLEEIREAYGPARDPFANRRAERASRLREYLPRMLEQVNLTMDDVSPQRLHDLGTAAGRFSVAFTRTFCAELADIATEIASEAAKPDDMESPKSIKSQNVDPREKMLETYLVMTCSICGVNECGIHGEYENTYRKFNMSFRSLLARRQRRLQSRPQPADNLEVSSKNSKPCSVECYLTNSLDRQPESWSPDELANLKALVVIMQEERHPPCVLAPFLQKPCYQVQKGIAMFNSGPSPKADVKKDKRTLDWYDSKRKKINTDMDWGMKTKAHMHDKRGQPRGCEHFGVSCNEAGQRCTCFQDEILCDKFCACPDDCYMKFTGCNCHYPCSIYSGVCPCALLNRECDPDICGECKGCRNMAIQRGSGKLLVIGESSHPDGIGYGAYMAEPAEKGEYVAEYVGEIITNEEAERRGLLYDELKMSFLFDLNADVVVDAYRFGNKTRFINHSSDYNCEAKIRLVNGEHRIGFFATRAVHVGEELFFDYGKKFAEKHGLTDAVPAFLKEATRGGRSRGRGGRGGRGGGRGRGSGRSRTTAASKFAPQSEPGPAAEAESVNGADDVQEPDGPDGGDENDEELLMDIPIDQTEDTSYSESGDEDEEEGSPDEDRNLTARDRPRRQNVMTKKYTR